MTGFRRAATPASAAGAVAAVASATLLLFVAIVCSGTNGGGTAHRGPPSGSSAERFDGRGVLNGAPPANAAAAAAAEEEEAGVRWSRRTQESGGRRGGEEEVDGGGGELRLRGDRRRRWRRWQQRPSVVGQERAGDEQEEGVRYEEGRSLGSFEHRPKRCFVATKEKRTRCHANIFFFGVSKCGTTSLAHWMAEHPELRWVTAPDKHDSPGSEAHVLEMMSHKDHAKAYPLTAPKAKEEDPVIDYTPHYSILADVPYKIVHLYGEHSYDGMNKYVVLLREPVKRTISSWQFKYDLHGKESGLSSERRTLEKVFSEGKRRVQGLVDCRSKHLEAGSLLGSRRRKADKDTCNPKRFLEKNDYFSHVGKSVYILQLERWINLFGRDNVKVLFLEEMAAEPVEALSSVFSFLGMDLLDEEREEDMAKKAKSLPTREKWEEIVRRNHNLTGSRRKEALAPQATPELVQEMRDYFAPFNAQLQDLLGRPVPENWSLPSGSRV